MKVLFDHPQPFFLAHGGLQIQIEQTKAALESLGIEIEYVRWWDPGQTGDLIHFFSVARADYLRLARLRKLPVVMTPLFSSTCNRKAWQLRLQGLVVRAILGLPFWHGGKEQLPWRAYGAATHLTVGLEAEKKVLVQVFRIDPSKISVIPLGISDTYLTAPAANRKGAHLITSGTIYPVKESVALALMARAARVPILFVGKPYDRDDPYWLEFQGLIDNQWVNYHAHVETEIEMIKLLGNARGFVLYSQFENWSLSASEAVACGLPLLVPDLNWSRERFGPEAQYFSGRSPGQDVEILRKFYNDSPHHAAPKVRLLSWREVASRLQRVYSDVLSSSR